MGDSEEGEWKEVWKRREEEIEDLDKEDWSRERKTSGVETEEGCPAKCDFERNKAGRSSTEVVSELAIGEELTFWLRVVVNTLGRTVGFDASSSSDELLREENGVSEIEGRVELAAAVASITFRLLSIDISPEDTSSSDSDVFTVSP